MNRGISKRVELNEVEANTLRLKADQCGLTEAEYLRELIMGCQPAEAPPRQFYERMEVLNQMGELLRKSLASADETVPPEVINELRGFYEKLIEGIVEIKEIVSKARFYALEMHDRWEHEVEVAKREGKIPPTFEEVEEKYIRKAILHPATDYELGWNALGIRPPFLGDGNDDQGSDGQDNENQRNDGWQNADEVPSQVQNTQKDSAVTGTSSAVAYAESNIFSPPRKEGET